MFCSTSTLVSTFFGFNLRQLTSVPAALCLHLLVPVLGTDICGGALGVLIPQQMVCLPHPLLNKWPLCEGWVGKQE